jgi:hypothetical protein
LWLAALGIAYLALLFYKWVAPDDRRRFWKPLRMTLLLTAAFWGLVVAVGTARARAWHADQQSVTVSEEPYSEIVVQIAHACQVVTDTAPRPDPYLIALSMTAEIRAFQCKHGLDKAAQKKIMHMVQFKICNHSRRTAGFVRWRAVFAL